jgi:hypothetical protein
MGELWIEKTEFTTHFVVLMNEWSEMWNGETMTPHEAIINYYPTFLDHFEFYLKELMETKKDKEEVNEEREVHKMDTIQKALTYLLKQKVIIHNEDRLLRDQNYFVDVKMLRYLHYFLLCAHKQIKLT